MQYDPQEHPIRSWVMYYRRLLFPLLLFTPTACVLNSLVLAAYGVHHAALAAISITGCVAAMIVYMAIVWIEGGAAPTQRKVQKTIAVIPTIIFSNIVLVLLVMAAATCVRMLIGWIYGWG